VKYCKLRVQNCCSWTVTWLKHVKESLCEIIKWASCWSFSLYTHPTHVTLQHSIMLNTTNGTVHSLTACSKDRPVLCQELSWTSQPHINNQQQSVQVQCIKQTARAGQSQYSKGRYGNIKTVLPSQEVQLKWGKMKHLHRSTWKSIAVATLPSMCGGLWAAAVSQTGVTSTKGPRNIQWYDRWKQLFG
jgi:hypothetical protein